PRSPCSTSRRSGNSLPGGRRSPRVPERLPRQAPRAGTSSANSSGLTPTTGSWNDPSTSGARHARGSARASPGSQTSSPSAETRRLMGEGPKFVIDRGLGVAQDLKHTESGGRIPDGDPHEVSDHAVKRGSEQCGTLGSGNHFLEVQVVDAVFDADVAKAFGLE